MWCGIFVVYFFLFTNIYSYKVPFTTLNNSIIDADGTVVRMRCVNWPGSMETLLPEGLQHNSIDNIVLLIKQMNMTCVRLTYSIDVTLSSNLTVYQSLSRLNLTFALQGFIENNPLLINTSVSNVFDSVLNTLGKYNILVLFDNHVSKAMWCCNDNDGNGFWGDKYFDIEQWINGLRFMANKTVDRPYVIAMSLRNELRGARQNQADWYRYVLRGIREAISAINPRLLIVISGLNYDLNLSFIRSLSIQELVPQSIQNKIVYEAHWYSWSYFSLSDDCEKMKSQIQNLWAFILESNHSYTAPVWLTEFGTNVDQFTGDDQFIDCIKGFLQTPLTNTMSWSYWVLAGNYYTRSGTVESHESFGLLTDSWKEIKSKSFIDLLSIM
jgi:endoglucanase